MASEICAIPFFKVVEKIGGAAYPEN